MQGEVKKFLQLLHLTFDYLLFLKSSISKAHLKRSTDSLCLERDSSHLLAYSAFHHTRPAYRSLLTLILKSYCIGWQLTSEEPE
jgi:hypothetical protein